MTCLIQVQDISFSYPGASNPALSSINFSLNQGESIGLIGPNGAGKSTLLLQLVGVLQGEGTISLNGAKITHKSLAETRRQIGLVLSNPDDQLFLSTVFDDIAFGPRNLGQSEQSIPQIVADALAKVGLSGFEQRPPHSLSSGEKRRVAIATVLAMNPTLLILDEPNNDLDPRARRELIDLLAQFEQAKIIASHDLDFINKTCSRCLVIHKGTIVRDGGCGEILEDAAFLEAHGLR